MEDGRSNRLPIEIVYNVEFASVLVSELQTNIHAQKENNLRKAYKMRHLSHHRGGSKSENVTPKQALQSYVSCSDRLLEKQ